jgi:hypothetical protein
MMQWAFILLAVHRPHTHTTTTTSSVVFGAGFIKEAMVPSLVLSQKSAQSSYSS